MSSQEERTAATPAAGGEPGEFYVEAAQLSRRDVAGVVLALVALACIGLGGYVWLNPALGWKELRGALSPRPPQTAAVDSTGSAGKQAAAADSDPLTNPAAHTHDMSCPHCGMYSDRSLAHIVVEWRDGSHSHHDCWDCAFAWGRSQQLELKAAVVTQFTEDGSEPIWLKAESATYLYDTKPFKGSMPPYTAAFASPAAAAAAQAALGGDELTWEALQTRFNSGEK